MAHLSPTIQLDSLCFELDSLCLEGDSGLLSRITAACV